MAKLQSFGEKLQGFAFFENVCYNIDSPLMKQRFDAILKNNFRGPRCNEVSGNCFTISSPNDDLMGKNERKKIRSGKDGLL